MPNRRKSRRGGYPIPKLSAQASTTTRAVASSHESDKARATAFNDLVSKTAGGGRSRRRRGAGCDTAPGLPTVGITYTSGASKNMSPNGNQNMKASQQLALQNAASSSLDSDVDNWPAPTQKGGSSELGRFMENLNNLKGGTRRRRKRRRRRSRRKKKRRRRRRKTRKRIRKRRRRRRRSRK